MHISPPIVSRLAPSPTGVLHLGNARSFLWAWCSARAQGGKVILRVEDLEYARARPELIGKMLDDLHWLGLDWDEGPVRKTVAPDIGYGSGWAESGPHGPYIQSKRRTYYQSVFERLMDQRSIYPCVCTRADIAAASSAPHEGEEGPRYPGTCRGRFVSAEASIQMSNKPPAWRAIVPEQVQVFEDLLFGERCVNVQATSGDFVVAKAPDTPSYQLAVVVDDIAMGVTEVVRGDDLIPSTGRQMILYDYLSAQKPRYGHAPIVIGPDGGRLAKRHGDARMASYRENGIRPEALVGLFARWSGLDINGAISARELVSLWDWKKLNKDRIILTPEKLREIDNL